MALYAGFACPREWKQRLTSREYEEAKALSRLEHMGPYRADWGRAKAAYFTASAMAEIRKDFPLSALLPNPPPDRAASLEEDDLAALQQLDIGLQQQVQ